MGPGMGMWMGISESIGLATDGVSGDTMSSSPPWFRKRNRELSDTRLRCCLLTPSAPCCPVPCCIPARSSSSSTSGVVARVKVDDVGDMGMEHTVAESGTTDELMVDDVGERSR